MLVYSSVHETQARTLGKGWALHNLYQKPDMTTPIAIEASCNNRGGCETSLGVVQLIDVQDGAMLWTWLSLTLASPNLEVFDFL